MNKMQESIFNTYRNLASILLEIKHPKFHGAKVEQGILRKNSDRGAAHNARKEAEKLRQERIKKVSVSPKKREEDVRKKVKDTGESDWTSYDAGVQASKRQAKRLRRLNIS